MKYLGFALGCGVSALAMSAAWATWTSWGAGGGGEADVIKANGRLEVQRIEIATKFPGRVLTVPVQEGDMVKQGAVLAQLDTTDLEAQLAGVQAMRQRAIQAMSRAQGEAQVRRIQASVAQMEFSNAMDLRKQVLVSDSEVKRRQAQRDGEQTGVGIATAAVGEAAAARDEADAGIRRLKLAIEDHTLRAPVDGRIEYRVVEPSSVIPAGGRVVTLLDTAHVHMTVFLPTKIAGQLRVGDEARIVLDAAPQMPLPAKVSFVAAEAQFTPKHVETASEREKLTYRVKLSVPQDVAMANAGLLKAGLTGNGYVRMRSQKADWPEQSAAATEKGFPN